jgi:hypothetical protein
LSVLRDRAMIADYVDACQSLKRLASMGKEISNQLDLQ